MPQLGVTARALTVGASESFVKHRTDRGLLIRLVDNVSAARITNTLRQTYNDIIVDAFLIADYSKSCLGRIQSTNQDCALLFILTIADVTTIGDNQRSGPL